MHRALCSAVPSRGFRPRHRARVAGVGGHAGDRVQRFGLQGRDDRAEHQVFELKAGERVQVLIVPGNQTRVFEGKGSHSLEPRGGARSATKRKQPE